MSTVVVEIDLRSAVEAVADTISTVVAEIDLTSAVEVVAEAISAAEVVDAAEAEDAARRRRATFRHQSQAGHRSARAARQRSRTLSLPLQGRRSHDLCGRHGAGRAEDRTKRSLACTRRIFAGRLRFDRSEIHDVERVGRTRRCELLFFTVSNRGVAMLSKASLVPLCAALLCWSAASVAQERFKTPEAAVDALVAAAKAEDTKALVGVLGPGW